MGWGWRCGQAERDSGLGSKVSPLMASLQQANQLMNLKGSENENPEDMGAAATRDNLVLQNPRSNETTGAIMSATIPQSNATLAHKGRVQWLWSQPGTRALLLLLLVLLVMEHMQVGMLQKAACNCLEREDCFLAVWFRTWNLQVYCLNE